MEKSILSGIYQIRNIINGNLYIGSAKDLVKRRYQHNTGLYTNTHYNQHLQRAFNKYGKENFIFEILEYCEPNKETLLQIEQKYINLLDPKYNMLKIAGSALGYKHSEETKKNTSIRMRNRVISDETRKRMSVSQTGKKLSQVTINKQVIYRIKPVLQINKKTLEILNEYPSIKAAMLNTGVDRASITKCFQGKLKSAGGFLWKLKSTT